MPALRKGLAAIALGLGTVSMMSATADAKDGIPARDCGAVYGALVSAGARAGSINSEFGPATHQGLHGVKPLLCGGG